MKYLLLLTLLLDASCNLVDASWLTVVRSVPVRMRAGGPRSNSVNATQRTIGKTGCRKDKQCGQGNFCHKHYGACHKCRKEAMLCRRHKMCCDGMECVSGVCRQRVDPGLENAICRIDRDCSPGLCCAKTNGQRVCKPMLGEGDLCSVPDGGIIYSISHSCPCRAGLKCRKVYKRERRSSSIDNNFLASWILLQERRCKR